MHPDKVHRSRLAKLTDLPNIGPAMADDLRRLGFERPDDLRGEDPYALYQRLSVLSGARQDPCVLDTFISITRFLAGEPPRPWWAYTDERKRALAGLKAES
jgi:hypothetical protein